MKPRAFKFHSAKDIESALELAQEFEDDFMYYAGGTEAIIALKERVISVGHVVDVKKIPGLKTIAVEGDSLKIGALVTHQEIADSPVVQEVLPSYAALSDNIANIRVRNAGTLAGNLCFAEPNADPPALLAALDAYVTLLGPDGERQVPVREFFDDAYSTDREDEELLTEIVIPLKKGSQCSLYKKIVYLNRPSVGVAVVRNAVAGSYEWEVWAGALTGVPERMDAVCSLLDSKEQVTEEEIIEAATEDASDWDVLECVFGSPEYRQHLATVLAARCVMELLDEQ